jgi:hypothetical protein
MPGASLRSCLFQILGENLVPLKSNICHHFRKAIWFNVSDFFIFQLRTPIATLELNLVVLDNYPKIFTDFLEANEFKLE